MPDREKVIKGLECCCAMSGNDCRKCPYGNECRDTDLPYGMPHLAADALALLKEQPEIVRCKDCKYAYLTSDGECKYCDLEKDDNGSLVERWRSWDWFCADGERRDDDG